MSNSVRPHRRQPTRLPLTGILQARTLEWVAISFSNALSILECKETNASTEEFSLLRTKEKLSEHKRTRHSHCSHFFLSKQVDNKMKTCWRKLCSLIRLLSPPFAWHKVDYAKPLKSCPTLCDPIDGSPPGSPVPGILQARTLEWVCHFLLQCKKVKSESEVTESCPTLSDPMDCSPPGSPSMGFSRQEYWSGVP